ncbi:hypothetical protein [Sinomonas terricola]|uniref:hypothetical protein n=1 Tax=Sinomonas terricola TaxID=3110330 RepID=UPI002B1FDB00|nr:hypothetical protein [Sinomonas sp. JGH33]
MAGSRDDDGDPSPLGPNYGLMVLAAVPSAIMLLVEIATAVLALTDRRLSPTS